MKCEMTVEGVRVMIALRNLSTLQWVKICWTIRIMWFFGGIGIGVVSVPSMTIHNSHLWCFHVGNATDNMQTAGMEHHSHPLR